MEVYVHALWCLHSWDSLSQQWKRLWSLLPWRMRSQHNQDQPMILPWLKDLSIQYPCLPYMRIHLPPFLIPLAWLCDSILLSGSILLTLHPLLSADLSLSSYHISWDRKHSYKSQVHRYSWFLGRVNLLSGHIPFPLKVTQVPASSFLVSQYSPAPSWLQKANTEEIRERSTWSRNENP